MMTGGSGANPTSFRAWTLIRYGTKVGVPETIYLDTFATTTDVHSSSPSFWRQLTLYWRPGPLDSKPFKGYKRSQKIRAYKTDWLNKLLLEQQNRLPDLKKESTETLIYSPFIFFFHFWWDSKLIWGKHFKACSFLSWSSKYHICLSNFGSTVKGGWLKTFSYIGSFIKSCLCDRISLSILLGDWNL